MNRTIKLLVLLVALLATATIFTVVASNYEKSQTPEQNFPFGPRIVRVNPGDIELYYVARTVFSTINIVLLIALIINYISIFLKTKSEFTIGLILFAIFFLIKDITWSPFVIGVFGFGLFGLGPFAFLPDLFELIGLSVLLYLSIKY
jgi:hypothetical protein